MSRFEAKTTVYKNGTALLRDSLAGWMTEAVQEIADLVLENTIPHVPVDTGELRDSGHTEDTGPMESDVVFDSDHAGYVHFGTSKMPARPYLADGLADTLDSQEVGAITDDLKTKIEGAGA